MGVKKFVCLRVQVSKSSYELWYFMYRLEEIVLKSASSAEDILN